MKTTSPPVFNPTPSDVPARGRLLSPRLVSLVKWCCRWNGLRLNAFLVAAVEEKIRRDVAARVATGKMRSHDQWVAEALQSIKAEG